MSEIETQCFLSVEKEEPLSVCVFHPTGFKAIGIKDFIDDSLIDMSRDMKLKYAMVFKDFIKRLED